MVNLAIGEILNSLADGPLDSSEEVLAYVRMHAHTPIPTKAQVEAILQFLNQYGFLSLGSKVKLNPAVADFLKKIKRIERGA